MRWDKTLARILLMFSIANVVLAAPALVRQRRLVTDRGDESKPDSLSDGPMRQNSLSDSYPWLDSFGEFSDEDPAPNSPASSHQDPVPVPEPPSGSLKQDLVPVSGAPHLHGDPPPVPGGPLLQPASFSRWMQTNERPPSQWEVGESSHAVPEMSSQAPEARPLQDEKVPWWHDPQNYIYQTSDYAPKKKYASTRWTRLGGFGGDVDQALGLVPMKWGYWGDKAGPKVAPQLNNDPSPKPGSSESNRNPLPTSGTPPSQGDPTPASEAAQLHNDLLPGSGDQPLHGDTATEIEQEAGDNVKKLKGLCDLFKCW